jgi:hypothetical protein
MDARMKQAVAIIIGALPVASALVFQAYQCRCGVEGEMGGPFVRLDTRTDPLLVLLLTQVRALV